MIVLFKVLEIVTAMCEGHLFNKKWCEGGWRGMKSVKGSAKEQVGVRVTMAKIAEECGKDLIKVRWGVVKSEVQDVAVVAGE